MSSTPPVPDAATRLSPVDAAVAPDTMAIPTRPRVIRFGAGFLAFGLLWAIGFAMVANVLLPQRLTDIGVKSPEALFGTINAITALVSLVSNLIFGNLSDRIRTPLGRRTPWIILGALISGVSLFFVGLATTPVSITVIYCITVAGLNMMLAPAVAVISDRVPLNVRGTMSAFYGAGATVGYPIGALVGATFITMTISGFTIGAVLMILGGIVAVVIWPRERNAKFYAAKAGGLVEILKSFRPPRHAPDFYKAFVGRLFILISYQMIAAYQLYIVQNYVHQTTLQSAATISTMSIISLVVGLVSSLAAGPISDRLGRRKAPVIVASVLLALGVAMPWILPSVMGMFLYAAIAGLGYGIYGSVDQALNVDVLPSKEEAGKDLGILNLATTLGQTLAPIITSFVVVKTGSYGLIFPISMVLALLGAFTITRIRTIR